ncbi:MAG: hypothetical protein EOM59_10705 [Clostridia bacterium]|nr:hypothetical protein [Clostridia bacterium]
MEVNKKIILAKKTYCSIICLSMKELLTHQKRGIEFLVGNNGIGALFWDTGTTKTRTALEVFSYYKKLEPQIKLFVICPITLIESSWADDIREFTPFTYENLRKTQILDADILLINYETIITARFQPTLRKLMTKNIMIVGDEFHKAKAYNSKTTKYLHAIGDCVTKKVILTATPAPNTELEYWSQMRFLSKHILGDNFFKFRHKFFCLGRGKSVIPLAGVDKRMMLKLMQSGYKMQLIPGAERVFAERLKPYCMFLKKREVLDLPDEVFIYRKVEMTSAQKKAYNQMKKDLVTELDGEQISVPLALAKYCKLRQITSGFLYGQDKTLRFQFNPKMEELKNVVEEIGKNKIIIFCQYKEEIREICRFFGERAYSLFSETKEKQEVIRRFRESPNGLLVTHPLTAGIGLSINECDYMVFFSLSYSYLEYEQCKGRILRAGKKNRATYIHILADQSIDEIIYEAVQKKQDNQEIYRRLMK